LFVVVGDNDVTGDRFIVPFSY